MDPTYITRQVQVPDGPRFPLPPSEWKWRTVTERETVPYWKFDRETYESRPTPLPTPPPEHIPARVYYVLLVIAIGFIAGVIYNVVRGDTSNVIIGAVLASACAAPAVWGLSRHR